MGDLFMAGAIEAPFSDTQEAINQLAAVAERVSAPLLSQPRCLNFWDVPPNHISTQSSPAAPGTLGAAFEQTIEMLKTVHGVGWVIAHKIAHHKWPNQVPLIDSKTLQHLPPGENWRQIYMDLVQQSAQFMELEAWSAALVAKYSNCRSLTRLRIHDILLWLSATGQKAEAIKSGDSFLKTGMTWARERRIA
jgi:hypothetical protein